MIKIALCDDEPGELSRMEDLIRQYFGARPDLTARLAAFSSGNELLKQAEDMGGFDLYMLDVIMPQLSGIDLGVKLRELGDDAPIIYLTTSPDYAVDSYLAQAFYYLLKPPDPARFYEVLDRATALLQKRKAASVPVKTKGGLRLVSLDELLYAELVGRAARYYLTGGETVNGMTLQGSFGAAMEPLLGDPRFVLCGSSFAVNLHYVTAVGKGELTIRGGRRIPLSRSLSDGVRKRWAAYWLNGGNKPC